MDPLKVLWVLTNSSYLVSKYRKNEGDKRPYFSQAVYQVEVEESVKPHHLVVTLTVDNHQKFSDIRYEISSGDVDNAFSVDKETGDIHVEGGLDYETRQKYELVYSATAKEATGFTSVVISVRDVNDNAPVFDKTLYTAEVTEEDDRNLPKKILQVAATDADRFQPVDIVYFLAGQGIDSSDPATGNFAIDKHSGEIFILRALDRDPPVGRAQRRFTVFAQDEGGKGLVGFADVQVNLKDINDNAPQFPQTEYVGNVTENGPKCILVLTLTAEDNDDPLENGNAKIKYSIEKNAIEEGSELPVFEINPITGQIRTLKCCFDRERTSEYSIQVVATDGAGLRGTGTVTINVLDINDSEPVFTKEEWITEVPETVGDVIPDTPVLTVAARDADENNRFAYSVVPKSGYGADRFAMVANVDNTGSLIVTQPLDFENPLQRNGFRFQIQVVDQDDNSTSQATHTAYSWVTVKLMDVNDNVPQFENPHPLVTVYEDIPVGSELRVLRARDGDQGGLSAVRYSIDRRSDRRRQFHISQEGKLTVHRSLDRETVARHLINVLAIDDGYPSQTGSVTVTIVVEDVNDNAPSFKEDYKPVVPENGKPQEILTIFAQDPDDTVKGNGPPFTFFMDQKADNKTKSSFRVVQEEEGEEDVAKVVSMVSFDRESQKEYLIPIVICDSGQPVRSSTNTLTVVIGDENDNLMKPGAMEVLAYVYRVQNIDVPIGRVYVDDMDDWDLPDKKFLWDSKDHHRFKLDEETGKLTMRTGTPRGNYELKFRVMDRKHKQSNVEARVKVRVKDLSYNTITNSGSLRLAGISAVQLMMKDRGKSKLALLQSKLAEVLEVEEAHISIFSVQQVLAFPPLTDVRFAVTNFKKEVLDGLLMLHSNQIEEAVKANITLVGVETAVCLEEHQHCEGSCSARLEVGGTSLVNANTTVLVGVRVAVVAECICQALDYSKPESCRSRPCFNGGRCVEGRYGISCSCPSGFTGPRCQKTARTFHGEGWAWFPPLKMCESSHLSLEFLARKADGQLVYNGPVGPPKPGGVNASDLLSIELVDGYPRLLMDYGSGTLELRVTTETRLNDSSWHRLDVMWNTEVVELVVDSCLGVRGLLPPSSCQARGSMPPFSEQLNLYSPLQLGGRHVTSFSPAYYQWTAVPYGKGFHGCIKNLFYNSELYDLAGSGLSLNSEPGCPATCPSEGCSLHGECVGSAREPRCRCLPGYQGPDCDLATSPVTLHPHSYIKYQLNFQPDPSFTRLELRFRTREESGELFRLGDHRSSQFAILEIVESHLKFRYRLSNSNKVDLRIAKVQINDGQWHYVKVSRVGSAVSLELDGGEGRRGNRTLDFSSRNQLVVDSEEGVYLGGKPEYTEIGIIAVEHDYQEGCVDDVRLNSRPLPLPPLTNSSAWAQALVTQNVEAGCPGEMCGGGPCSRALDCADPWNSHTCFCGEGKVLTADGKLCVKNDDCFVKPCSNGGVCLEVDSKQQYRCSCPQGYWGDQCELVQDKQTLRLGVGAFATVMGCILLILLIFLLMLVIYNRRKENVVKKQMENDVRENIIKYNDEGGGVEDMTGVGELTSHTLADVSVSETSFTDLTKKPVEEKDDDYFVLSPSQDEIHIYTFEGEGSYRGSLSSLSMSD